MGCDRPPQRRRIVSEDDVEHTIDQGLTSPIVRGRRHVSLGHLVGGGQVGQFHGILHSVATAIGAATTEAPQWPNRRRGRIPQGLFAPGTVTVPLRSRRKASSFGSILLLVSGRTDHGLIRMRSRLGVAAAPIIGWLLVPSPTSPTTQSCIKPLSCGCLNSL